MIECLEFKIYKLMSTLEILKMFKHDDWEYVDYGS